MSTFDLGELVKRAIKYLVEGLIVALAAYAIPKKSLNFEEIAVIALTAAATFSLLDVFIPAVAQSGRSGLGFSIGTGLAGGIRLAA